MVRVTEFVVVVTTAGRLPAAETYRVNDDAEFGKAVAAAKPGDRILLAAGDYRSDFHFTAVRGSNAAPIVIAADDPKRPPRFVGKTAPLHFTRVAHLELRDLVIEGARGNGLNVDDGGDPDKPSHHLTLRRLHVRDIGTTGNSDGIKFSGVDEFLVQDCTVERWGRGGSGIDMVGCHHGVIAGCVFRKGGANAVQTKGGSADVTVRTCRFEDAGDRAVNLGGSTGNAYFRPRLTAFPPGGKYEAKDVRVEGCTVIGGGAAVAFVGVDGATVRYNTIYRPGRYAIRILQEKTDAGFVPSRNGAFERNVVVFRSDAWASGGVNVGPNTAPKSFTFTDNLWYCEDRPDRSRPILPAAETGGLVGMNPQFTDPAKYDFSVGPGSPARDRGAHALPLRK